MGPHKHPKWIIRQMRIPVAWGIQFSRNTRGVPELWLPKKELDDLAKKFWDKFGGKQDQSWQLGIALDFPNQRESGIPVCSRGPNRAQLMDQAEATPTKVWVFLIFNSLPPKENDWNSTQSRPVHPAL